MGAGEMAQLVRTLDAQGQGPEPGIPNTYLKACAHPLVTAALDPWGLLSSQPGIGLPGASSGE